MKAVVADDLDDHRVKLSDAVFEMIDKKQRKFMEAYDLQKLSSSTSNILRHESVVEIMKRKKLELERAQMEKYKL